MKKAKVIAAIPTYNAAKTLPTLLDELIRQNYDEIFVLDDASSDSTVNLVKSYGSKVHLIEGKKNCGSGANRNRIIGQSENSIIHFIDADMKLLSKNTPEIIRSMKWSNDTAYIAGMVRNPDGSQNPFNYGPRQYFVTAIKGTLQYILWRIGMKRWALASFGRWFFSIFLIGLPDIYRPPKKRQTFWTAESNMIIKSQMFAKLGGYDPQFRYSEVSEFSTRLHRLGLKVFFDPTVDVLHASNDNVFNSRAKRQVAFNLFIKKIRSFDLYLP